jgi:hypothetical protein
MNRERLWTIVVGAAIVLAGFLVGGRYQIQCASYGTEAVVYRLDKFTGSLDQCMASGGRAVCIHLPDEPISLPGIK